MSIFTRKREETSLVVSEKREVPATIQVRDIKEYLVEEYERSRELLAQNDRLKERIAAAEEIKLKYDAALVTLDEYNVRLDDMSKRLGKADRDMDKLREERNQIRDELNSYKIANQRLSMTKSEIRAEVFQEAKQKILEVILAQKGTLSRDRIRAIIEEV